MEFNSIAWLTNPYILMFISVFSGLIFGKVKFGKFNFGISGTLFTGLLIGFLVSNFGKGISIDNKNYELVKGMFDVGIIPSEFFYLFLILFVASVGLLASKDMAIVLKKYGLKFVVLGFMITLIGALTTYGMTLLSPTSNPYKVSGVYTGALTSSPGLAAAIETAKDHARSVVDNYENLSQESKNEIKREIRIDSKNKLLDSDKLKYIKRAEEGIGLGYAVGYPFGVLVVILAVNFIPQAFNICVDDELLSYKEEIERARKAYNHKAIGYVDFDLIGFSLVCFLGYTLGKIKIYLGPLGYFGLGSTGGVLIIALLLGYIGKIGPINFRMNNKILGVIREVSLSFFLSIVGLRYGNGVFTSLMSSGGYLALISIVVGTVSILSGFFIGRYIFKLNWVMLVGAICGGMTSTPGLGASIDAIGSDDPAAGYGATYPFALLGMVLFTIILHKLPM